MKLFITDANDSPAKQVSDLEDYRQNSNGLIIGAATTDVANPILERCWNDKIPVIIVDRKVNSDKYTSSVSSDNHYMATKALGKLIELVGGKGKIAIVEGIPGSGPAVERNIAYDELLKKNPGITACAKPAIGPARAASASLKTSARRTLISSAFISMAARWRWRRPGSTCRGSYGRYDAERQTVPDLDGWL